MTLKRFGKLFTKPFSILSAKMNPEKYARRIGAKVGKILTFTAR